MNPYKHWSESFRKKSLRLTNKAKTHGWIAEPKACSTCGVDGKRIDLHNSDYDVTFNTLKAVFKRKPISISKEEKEAVNAVLTPLCRSCHLKIHKAERAEADVKTLEELDNGTNPIGSPTTIVKPSANSR